LKILANGRAGLAARTLGSCKRLLEHCLDYVQEREQFGKKLIDIQAVQHMLAEISKEIAALEALTYKVAWMTDQNMRVMKDAAIAKIYGSEVNKKQSDVEVQHQVV